jgi:predicted HD phosphohydrolase
MITVWNATPRTAQKHLSEKIVEFLYLGLEHENADVRRRIREATHIASRAASDNAESAMVVAALLYVPCQMLSRGEYSSDMWTGDSLLESGTHDWLLENFGPDIAEVIRLQPHAFRYLSSVVPGYFQRLDSEVQKRVYREGGMLSPDEQYAFANSRYFANTMRLSSWIDKRAERWMESHDIDFFAYFLESVGTR